jgi:predicted aspartyl protease
MTGPDLPGMNPECTVHDAFPLAGHEPEGLQLITRRALLAATFGIGVLVCGIAAAQTSKCKVGRIAEWPVRPDRNHLIVDGAINGQPVAIILDTGASRTLILRAAAERLRLPRQDLNLTMYGVGGPTKAEAGFVDEFKVGDAISRNMRMFVAGEGDFGADVFLGEDFFRMVDVEFDWAHNMVRLYQAQNCDGVSLAYWASEGAGEVEIEPVDEIYPQIVLTVRVNGKPIKAMFGFRCLLSVLGKSDAARLGVTPETPGVVAGNKWGGLGSKSIETWIGPSRVLRSATKRSGTRRSASPTCSRMRHTRASAPIFRSRWRDCIRFRCWASTFSDRIGYWSRTANARFPLHPYRRTGVPVARP